MKGQNQIVHFGQNCTDIHNMFSRKSVA